MRMLFRLGCCSALALVSLSGVARDRALSAKQVFAAASPSIVVLQAFKATGEPVMQGSGVSPVRKPTPLGIA